MHLKGDIPFNEVIELLTGGKTQALSLLSDV